MADRKDELLQHVIANPSDDDARLVYADYLIGQGDPRGAFINAQVPLASRINPARRRKHTAIASKLMADHRKTFTAALTACGVRGIFRRGFVDEVIGSASSFVSGGANLVATEPVQRLALSGASDDDLEAMITDGLLGNVHSLRLHDGPLGDKGVAALAASEQLASIRTLNLANNEIGDAGIEALAKSPHFRARSLTLNANQITSEGLRAIAISPPSKGLEALYVARNLIDDRAPAWLLASSYLETLKRVSLTGNEELGDSGVLAFAEPDLAGRFSLLELEQIDLSRDTRDRMRDIWGDALVMD